MASISDSKSLGKCLSTPSPLCLKCSIVLGELEKEYDVLEDMYRKCNESTLLVDSAISKHHVLCPTTFYQVKDSAHQCHLCALIGLHCAGNTTIPHDQPVSLKFHPGKELFSAVTSDDKIELNLGIQRKYAYPQTSLTPF
jgi:hypothetical protein